MSGHTPWSEIRHKVDLTWPIPMRERARLALLHEPEASSSPDGFRLATCVVCKRPMVAMWHLWLNTTGVVFYPEGQERMHRYVVLIKEIHMCHACATDIYGAPYPSDDTWWEIDAQAMDAVDA